MLSEPKRTEVEEKEMVVVSPSTADLDAHVGAGQGVGRCDGRGGRGRRHGRHTVVSSRVVHKSNSRYESYVKEQNIK